jgi:hypothetical protein
MMRVVYGSLRVGSERDAEADAEKKPVLPLLVLMGEVERECGGKRETTPELEAIPGSDAEEKVCIASWLTDKTMVGCSRTCE